MSGHQSEALTLRTYPFSESHKIAVFFTRSFGKLRGIAHGARNSRGRFGGSLEPLNHVRLSFRRKEHQELAVIRSCEVLQVFPRGAATLESTLYLSYFTELLLEFSREQEESEHLFRLALAILGAVGSVPISLLSRYLELWTLRLEGVLPDLDDELPRPLAARARSFMRVPPASLEAECLTLEEDKTLARFSEKLLEYHLEKPLKTRKLLKELL